MSISNILTLALLTHVVAMLYGFYIDSTIMVTVAFICVNVFAASSLIVLSVKEHKQ